MSLNPKQMSGTKYKQMSFPSNNMDQRPGGYLNYYQKGEKNEEEKNPQRFYGIQ